MRKARIRPRFSLVIPTYNRAELLPGALRSALRQTWRDLEVVVSDNRSDDATPVVVARADDPRVRYIRSSSFLLMHESWRFALRAARGAYVGFLCDDDALHPVALELVERVIHHTGADVVAWRSCSYCFPDWPDGRHRGRVRFGPPFSDRVWEIDGGRLVELAYDVRVTFSELVPKMLNCVVSRRLIDRIQREGADLFHPSSPDYSAMLVLAACARRMVLIDVPLLVAGATMRSLGASTLVSYDSARRYEAPLRARQPGLVLPPALGPRITWLAQTYMQCARSVPALQGREVNPVHLYGLAQRELERARAAGVPADDFIARHEAALRTRLAPHAAAIRAFARERQEIESEAFLKSCETPELMLGLGPFMMNDPVADPRHTRDSGHVAAALEGVIRRHSTGLDALHNELHRRAGPRRVVLYGLGRNGRALLRASPLLRSSVFWCDDHAHCPNELRTRRVASDDLRAETHYVCITVDEAEPITTRLRRHGLSERRDWSTMREVCAPRSTALAAGFARSVRGSERCHHS